jgi:hypothetical protein
LNLGQHSYHQLLRLLIAKITVLINPNHARMHALISCVNYILNKDYLNSINFRVVPVDSMDRANH